MYFIVDIDYPKWGLDYTVPQMCRASTSCFKQLRTWYTTYTQVTFLTGDINDVLFAAAEGDSRDSQSQKEAKVNPAEERKSLVIFHVAQHLFPSVCR